MVSAQPLALKNQQLTQVQSVLGTFWHRARSARVADLLQEVGSRHVVDVGAGAGHLGGWLARYHPDIRYRFLEPMTDLNDRLSERFGQQNLVGSSRDIGDADAVTSLDVLEHIDDDHAFLRDLFDNMNSGAQLILTVPAGQWLYSEWDAKLGHHRRYSRASLVDVVESAGFDLRSTTFLFPELLLPAALRKLPGLQRSDESAEFPTLPRWVDWIAFRISSLSARLGKLCPTGTSLLAVATKP